MQIDGKRPSGPTSRHSYPYYYTQQSETCINSISRARSMQDVSARLHHSLTWSPNHSMQNPRDCSPKSEAPSEKLDVQPTHNESLKEIPSVQAGVIIQEPVAGGSKPRFLQSDPLIGILVGEYRTLTLKISSQCWTRPSGTRLGHVADCRCLHCSESVGWANSDALEVQAIRLHWYVH